MIYYIVSVHNLGTFAKYAGTCIDRSRSVLVYDSKDLDSMTKKYNYGYEKLNTMFKLDDEDVVCFLHEDYKFVSNVENQVQKEMSDLGADIAGIAGTKRYYGYGWWTFQRPLYGYSDVLQGYNNGDVKRIVSNPEKIPTRVAVVDGCCMFVKNKVLKKIKWDESLKGYDHYDNVFCMDAHVAGFKTFVVHALGFHASEGLGSTKESYIRTSEELINKYREKGVLPIIMD